MVSFGILGPLEIVCDGKARVPSAPKVRCLLGLLLARSGQVVTVENIIDELWGMEPPRSAVTTTQTYVCHLRKRLEEAGVTREPMLETAAPGYRLSLAADMLDAERFERLAGRGRLLATQGELADAAQLLREALGLWRGPALANVACGPLLSAHVAHLDELRLRTLELRIGVDFALGRDRELIPELRSLTALYPLNEWFHGRLIDALRRAGRRADALHAYRKACQVLADELGLDPSPELRRRERMVLLGEEEPARPTPDGRSHHHPEPVLRFA